MLVVSCAFPSFAETTDPFARYRGPSGGKVSIQEKGLTKFADAEKLILQKLKLDLSQRERAILGGLHYLITSLNEDSHFDGVFSDFILLLTTLSHSEDRVHQRDVIDVITRTSLARAQDRLPLIYKSDEKSRGNFLYILQALWRYKNFQGPYFDFYRRTFKPIPDNVFQQLRHNFALTIATADYRGMFGLLVGPAMVHFYRAKETSSPALNLPKDDFVDYLKDFEKFRYIDDHPALTNQFRDLGYLATHVVLLLTNYGEFPLPGKKISRDAANYIEASLARVEKELGDFDLFAEYIQCIKLISRGRDERISRFEKFIYDLQRTNGAWGSDFDFMQSAYTAIHPTGAALMALNQSNLASPKSLNLEESAADAINVNDYYYDYCARSPTHWSCKWKRNSAREPSYGWTHLSKYSRWKGRSWKHHTKYSGHRRHYRGEHWKHKKFPRR